MGTSNEKRGSVGNRPMEGSPRQLPKDGELEMIRERQRARSRIVALLLGAFVVLLFFITIAKTGMNW
jgi:hypothetical protein